MARFCKYCGSPVREDARFCKSCGKPLAAKANVRPEARQPTDQAPTRQAPAAASPTWERQTREAPASRTASARMQEAARQAASVPQLRELTASASAGEVDLGTLSLPGLSGAAEPVAKVLSPVSGILHGIGSFFGGIVGIFKRPGALIGTVLLAALWFVLAQLRDSDAGIVKLLSWLTYAEGGFDRSALGAVGGVLGKGTVAAGLVSLFNGGGRNAVSGIGKLFNGSGEKRGVVSILLGVVIGAAAYLVFVGPDNASGSTAMAGISGVLLSLEALGGGNGKLYELAQSLTSRKANGIRTAMRGKCDGLLTGLTIGFALATALSAFL